MAGGRGRSQDAGRREWARALRMRTMWRTMLLAMLPNTSPAQQPMPTGTLALEGVTVVDVIGGRLLPV